MFFFYEIKLIEHIPGGVTDGVDGEDLTDLKLNCFTGLSDLIPKWFTDESVIKLTYLYIDSKGLNDPVKNLTGSQECFEKTRLAFLRES